MTSKTEKNAEISIKADDRVKRTNETGCLGTVLDLHSEVTGTSGESGAQTMMVQVKWDNGTVSYFDPVALEVVK